jgi:hypothetical protein
MLIKEEQEVLQLLVTGAGGGGLRLGQAGSQRAQLGMVGHQSLEPRRHRRTPSGSWVGETVSQGGI